MEIVINIGAFILEDDLDMHDIMMDALKENNLMAEITDDPELFISKLKSSDINICVLDHILSGEKTGLDMITEVKRINKWSVVIVMSGQSKMDIALEYMNLGATKYINKNWDEKILNLMLCNKNIKDPTYIDVLVKFIKEGIEEAKERVEMLNFGSKFKELLKRNKE